MSVDNDWLGVAKSSVYCPDFLDGDHGFADDRRCFRTGGAVAIKAVWIDEFTALIHRAVGFGLGAGPGHEPGDDLVLALGQVGKDEIVMMRGHGGQGQLYLLVSHLAVAISLCFSPLTVIEDLSE